MKLNNSAITQENNMPQTKVEHPYQPNQSKIIIKTVFITVLIVVCIVSLFSGGYLLGKNYTPINSPLKADEEKQPTATPSPIVLPTVTSVPTQLQPPETSTPIPTIRPSPTTVLPTRLPFDVTTEAIIRAFATNNYSPLRSYLASRVTTAIEATECCAGDSPEQALQFIEGKGRAHPNWTFDIGNSTINQIKSRNYDIEYYFIGIASDRAMIGFKLDINSKIIHVVYAGDYRIYTGE